MPTITASIRDYIATKGSQDRVIDLASVFSGTGLTYTVTNSNSEVVAASISDGKLVFNYSDVLGHADLKITATDAVGISVTDNVRVRVAGENAYTIAVLPDTQDYTNAAGVGTFKSMTQWLVDNKEGLGIQFVTHVGDITTENGTNHWPYAKEALSILDGKIPYGLTLGNHDGISGNFDSSRINQYFSVDDLKRANGENFGGTYDQEATLSNNTYSTCPAPDGTNWLVLNLEFGAREDVVRWAGDVIEGHLDHRVILTTHSYMNWAGRHDATGAPLYDEGTGYDYGLGNSLEAATDGETMYRELVQKYPNVSFTFSGHIFGDGAETLVSYDQFGNPVHQMMVNYQNGVSTETTSDAGQGSGTAGGNGAIRLVTIDPENGSVYTSTYFAKLDDYMDSNRGDGELDRDGLTGPYRGHEETITGLDLGTPDMPAIAKAGNDQFVRAEADKEQATVTLEGDWTLNPGEDAGLSFSWTDHNGTVVATSATPTLQLDAGQHQLKLTVTDSAGRVSTDDVRIVVSNANTLLTDDFNDGNASGWGVDTTGPQYATRSTAELGIAALPGGTGQEAVTSIPKLGQADGGVLVKLDGLPTGSIAKSYSLVYDVMISPGVANYFSFLQTDLTNKSDQDIALLNRNGSVGGIGIAGDYEGTVTYGTWHRVAFTVTDRGDSVLINKYIDGVKVGDTVQSGGNYGRYQIDMSKGFLLFADESDETWPSSASSFLFTDKVLSDNEVSDLGGVKPGGIMDVKPSANSVQIDFSTPAWKDEFATGSAASITFDTSGTGTFLVKGSVASRPTAAEGEDAVEGRLFEQSDSAGKLLIWKEGAAHDWSDYVFESTVKTTDNDGIGLVFYHQNAANHYKLVLDAETNTRSLVKVQNGTESVLARENGGTPWSRDFQVKVVVADGKISAFLDGHSLFGEIVDADPLTSGTVGFLSNNQRSSQFDNVSVNKVALTAHAGDDLRPVDADGDGKVTVDLDAGSSYGLGEIVSYVWTDAKGEILARGETAQVSLDAVKQNLKLTVTDAAGKTATDVVTVDAISKARVLLSDAFNGADYSGWTIVDEGEFGGVGAAGTQSQWEMRDGALFQLSGLKSKQLEWNGASNTDPWLKGWSPLGDGVNVLRKGTYALYDNAEAKDWKNYAVETTIQSPDNGALGLLFYYQDANNYYKLELDANGDYDRNPSNGAGSLFQLIQVKDGVEKYLNQFPAKYTPGEAFQLRVEVKDGKIQGFVDGMALFAYAIEDRAQTKGTVGLFSWDSAGVSFDNVMVTDLSNESTLPSDGGDLVGTAGDDLLLGTAAGELIAGLAGDDQLSGLAGDDTLEGGEGDDTLEGGEGNDELLGGIGDDVLRGEEGDDVLEGGAGDDEINGGAGTDTLVLAGTLRLDLASGTITGEALGNDVFTDIEAFRLGAGDDVVTLVAGVDPVGPIDGGDGEDRLVLTGTGTLGALVGIEQLRLEGDWRVSGPGADVAFTQGAQILALDGDFTGTISGLGQEDRIRLVEIAATGVSLGAGNVLTLTGGAVGPVALQLDPSEDYAGMVFALESDGVGDTYLTYAPEPVRDDVFVGTNGNDVFDGGAGNDNIHGGAGEDRLFGGSGEDRIDAGSGNDTVLAGTGDDVVKGGSGVDMIDAGDGDDMVDAGSENDTILGGAGNDEIKGGSGADRIEGGVGNDMLSGGSGVDVFVFAAGFGRDAVRDFTASGFGADLIEFAADVFSDYADVANNAAQAGADVVISVDAENALTLQNVQLANLTADDFRFLS